MAYHCLKKYLILIFAATFLLFVSPVISMAAPAGLTAANASSSVSSGGVAPISAPAGSASSIAPVPSVGAINPSTRATTTNTATPAVIPKTNGTGISSPIATSSQSQSTFSPQAQTQNSATSPTPTNYYFWILVFVGSVIVVAAIIFTVLKFIQNKIKNSNDNEEEKEKNEDRCLNFKKLMEDKLEELTDLQGKIEDKTKEVIKTEIKESVEGTYAGDIVAKIEKAQKEYEKLKLLYEKCIIDIKQTKRVFIVHGWDGTPQEGWFPWLKRELEKKGFEVCVPQLPDTESPRIFKWVPALAAAVGTPDSKTYFVGHSMGCQAIARYLETMPEDQKVGGAVFVAGFFKHLAGLEDDPGVHETATHWLETPIDLNKVKTRLPKSIAIFSDDDPWVPLDNQDDFKTKLDSEIVIEHAKGHFNDEGLPTKELPVVLDSILKFSN